jgi:hypothetical protein
MSRTGEEVEVPLKFNEEGNPIIIEEGSKKGALNALTLEDLMRKVEKLTVENKKFRAKVKCKKTKGSSSSSEEENSSFEEEVSKEEKKEEETMISLPITHCILITIICLALLFILSYPLAKLHILMELIIINGSIA